MPGREQHLERVRLASARTPPTCDCGGVHTELEKLRDRCQSLEARLRLVCETPDMPARILEQRREIRTAQDQRDKAVQDLTKVERELRDVERDRLREKRRADLLQAQLASRGAG